MDVMIKKYKQIKDLCVFMPLRESRGGYIELQQKKSRLSEVTGLFIDL